MSLFWDSWVRCKALKVINDYSLPPTLKCISRKAFLPIPDPRMPCQDYREGHPHKTLAYAQVLQYWAEKANLPKPDEPCLLVRCIHKLRQAMGPFTTFTDGAVFGGTTLKAGILEEGATELSTTETTWTPVPERRPATSPEMPAAPSAEEPDVLATASGEPTTELTRGPATSPTPPETDKKVEESPPCELPSWTQIHSSHLATPVGWIPSSWAAWGGATRVAVLVREGPNIIGWKNKGEVDRGTPVQLHSTSPLCLTPLWKVHQKSHCLASGRSPSPWQEVNPHESPVKVPQDLMSPSLLVRPTMTMLMSTRINWDEATSITYVDMVTASVGLVALEMSCRAVDPYMPILEEGAQGESTVITDVTNLWKADDNPK